MKVKKFQCFKRIMSFLLAFCLVFSGMAGAAGSSVYAAEGDGETETQENSTTVYFYNSDNWETVKAYVYGDGVVGGAVWPGVDAQKATEIGESWWKATVEYDASETAFNIIFNNGSDEKKTKDTYITRLENNYMLGDGNVYLSAAMAEVKLDTGEGTMVYFLNSSAWENVGAHAYIGGTAIIGEWGTVTAYKSDIGDNWMELPVPATTDFNVIFYDTKADSNRADISYSGENVYGTLLGGAAHATKEEAESAWNDTDTVIYFYDSNGWENIKASFSGEENGEYTDTDALSQASIGDDWYQTTIEMNATQESFFVKFYDADADGDANTNAVEIKSYKGNYVTGKGELFTSQEAAENSINPSGSGEGTKVYFYDSDGWYEKNEAASADVQAEGIGLHAWNSSGDLTGNWNSTHMNASEIGSGWYELTVNARPEFDLIIFDRDNDSVRYASKVENTTDVYFTKDGRHASKEAAEYAVDPSKGIAIYFYNSSGWETVGAYAYEDLIGEWPGVKATAADVTEDGTEDAKWVKVICPSLPSGIIFFDTENEAQRAELALTDEDTVYVAMNEKAYASANELLEEVTNEQAVIYFLNDDNDEATTNWEKVYAYAADAEGNPVGDKANPGYEATRITTLGEENWYTVTIPVSAIMNPFTVTFNDGTTDGNSTEAYDVKLNTDNYASLNGMYDSKSKALNSVGLGKTTTVYFLNSQDWPEVGAYVWGDPGEVLGKWNSTTLTETLDAEDGVTKTWYKLDIPSGAPFNLILYNMQNEVDRIDLELKDDSRVYITPNGLWSTREEAELSEGIGDLSKMTTVYFLNHRNWGDINAYMFTKNGEDSITLGKTWPGKAATKEDEIGTSDNWWSVAVPKDASVEGNEFYVIFNDGVNQTDDIMISDKESVYAIAYGDSYELFTTAEEAEAKALTDTFEDYCEEGPNEDITNYKVSYSGAGAALPYVTYEAEAGVTNATILEKQTAYTESVQSEASGRQAVELDAEGEYVSFTLTQPANSVVLRYSIPDSEDGTGIDATLSMYVGETEKQNLELTSKYAWVYGTYPFNNDPTKKKPHRYFDEVRVLFEETMPTGTVIKLQKDADDTAANYVVDFIDCELVGAPEEQPENSISVTEYGAIANDGVDDAEAFSKAIEEAEKSGKEVWIPAGTFLLEKEEALELTSVTIRGAGMWHTNLVGAGVSFHYKGTCKFYDFAMTGVSTVRDDKGDLAGFEGMARSSNVTIQNIWMEHMKVGVWANNTDRLAILGCRIRNTYADGINMCSGTQNALVENNNLRNTGDDGIAIWPWLADCGNNTIRHNTVMVPTLANGIAIYGGYGHVVESNHVYDTINNGGGICLGTEFDTAKPYSGTIRVRGNLLERCGSMQSDEKYQIGAVWVWAAAKAPMTSADYIIEKNTVKDSQYAAFLIECENKVDDVVIQGNTVEGGSDVIHVSKTAEGGGSQSGNAYTNISGELINNENENFTFTDGAEETAVDKTQLQELLTTCNALVQSDYTQESWSVFASKRKVAQDVADNEYAAQEEVDAAKTQLQAAKEALVSFASIIADAKEELSTAVEGYETLKESDYTAESWAEFTAKLEAAKAVIAKEDATLEEVEAAKTDLESAVDALVTMASAIEAAKTELTALIAGYETLKESDYTAESWAEFTAKLTAAKAVIAKEDATLEEVETAKADFETAIDELVTIIEATNAAKNELEALIAGYETLKESDYTAESWQVFAAKLEAAKAVVAKEDATLEEVKTAKTDLESAMDALVTMASVIEAAKAELKALVEGYETLKESDYTAASWTVFESKLEAAKAVVEKAGATLEEIEAAKADLEKAVETLVTIASEREKAKKDLQAVIDGYAELKESDYTAESWEVFAARMADARAVISKADATLTEIHTAKIELQAAYGKLQKAGSEPGEEPGDEPGTEKEEKTGLWAEDIADQVYTGKAIKPAVTVYDGETLLKVNKDYTIKYSFDKNVGEGLVKITGKGNYRGTVEKTFNIVAKDLADADIVVADLFVNAPTGKKVKAVVPKPVVTRNGKKLKVNKDYVVETPDTAEGAYVKPGTYQVTILPAENSGYTGKKEITITLADSANQVLMSKVSVAKIADQKYNSGEEVKPEVTVTYKGKTNILTPGEDYTVSYSNNKEIGTATVTITGTGTKYVGTKSVTFKIVGEKLTSKMISGVPKSAEYTGSAITPEVTVEGLEKDKNYTVEYQNNIEPGKATIVVKGIKDYTGTVKKTFTITKYDIKNNSENRFAVVSENIKAVYAKGGSRPDVEVTFNGEKLEQGVHYTLSYQNNKAVGGSKQPTIIIKGKGNFKGTVSGIPFEIEKQKLENLKATAGDIPEKNAKKYDKVNPVIKDLDGKILKKGTDYTIAGYTYADGSEIKDTPAVGAVIKVTAEGSGNYEGTITAEFKVMANDKQISKATVKVAEQTYTGKAKEPSGEEVKVTIKVKEGNKVVTKDLTEGTDYKIVGYTSNINKGTAKLTIQGMGEYGGTKTVSFKIKAQEMDWADWYHKTAAFFEGLFQ